MNSTALIYAGFAVVVIAIALGFIVARNAAQAEAPSAAEAVAANPQFSVDPGDEAPKALWSELIAGDDGPLTVDGRLQMISRLEEVKEQWSEVALNAALDDDDDPRVRDAARAALQRLVQLKTPD